MKENYDFYKVGIRYAIEGKQKLEKAAQIIEEKYGKDARIDFEAGIISSIDVYSKETFMTFEEHESLKGTANYGIPETRNNSYFNETEHKKKKLFEEPGESCQYVIDENGNKVYNDPEKNIKRR